MKNLAIKGHSTRGNEVIKILEMLGGYNFHSYSGDAAARCYYIDNHEDVGDVISFKKIPTDSIIFTLEEFLEKFPYKVGDKVKTIYGKIGIINKPIWSNRDNCIRYELKADTDSFYFGNELQPYKEETMDKAHKVVFDANAQCCDITNNLIKNETMKEIKLDIPDGYKFFGVDNDNQQVVFTKIQPQYPKTYEECCDVLGIEEDLWFVYEDIDGNHINPACISNYRMRRLDLYHNLEKLLICRDAYWKISGDWKPEFRFGKKKYCVMTKNNKVISATVEETNRILVFPTEEMRDAFYVNFEDLIEECKDLL